MLATPRPLESLSGQAWDAGHLESLNLPASLCAGLRLTPEQFAELCGANPDAVLELAADGFLICMTAPEVTRAPATAPSVACSGRP